MNALSQHCLSGNSECPFSTAFFSVDSIVFVLNL